MVQASGARIATRPQRSANSGSFVALDGLARPVRLGPHDVGVGPEGRQRRAALARVGADDLDAVEREAVVERDVRPGAQRGALGRVEAGPALDHDAERRRVVVRRRRGRGGGACERAEEDEGEEAHHSLQRPRAGRPEAPAPGVDACRARATGAGGCSAVSPSRGRGSGGEPPRSVRQADGVADAHRAGAHDVGAQPAAVDESAQHARPGEALEMRARLAPAPADALDLAEQEAPADQRIDVDPAGDDVAAGVPGATAGPPSAASASIASAAINVSSCPNAPGEPKVPAPSKYRSPRSPRPATASAASTGRHGASAPGR